MLTNHQFERARRLALSLAGIELVERHRDLLQQRSRRAGILENGAMDALLNDAEAGGEAAVQRLLCLVTTKHTGFFRHPAHFRIAAEHSVEAAARRGRAMLWSAAAATGEEPYSLAIAMIEAFGRDDPPAGILATDVDSQALAAGRSGEYGELAMQGLNAARRERFFLPAGPAGRWRLADSACRLVEFRPLNLARDDWALQGPFDVIFCRNALMYLEERRRLAALERLAALLEPEGVLLLDPAEHLGRAGHLFAPLGDGAYRPAARR